MEGNGATVSQADLVAVDDVAGAGSRGEAEVLGVGVVEIFVQINRCGVATNTEDVAAQRDSLAIGVVFEG